MRPFLTAAGLAASLAVSAPAQDPAAPPDDAPQQKRVVVTATRTGVDPFELPYSATVLDAQTLITERQVRTTPEGLREVPAVSVQKTAHGQGSPKIRGQTGFQTLLLVDGIRMNDSTWRAGNVEYWNHHDPYSFERFELVRGPAAVPWGSDANFGVGQIISKAPREFAPGLHARTGALVRFATAEDSIVSRLENTGNADDFGWHIGITHKDYGDLEAGRDVGLLARTGYEEADGDMKLAWRISDRQTLTFALQHANLRDVPRTHSTTGNVAWRGLTPGSDLQRNHTHRRWLSYLRFEVEDAAFDSASFTVAYKNRYERQDRIRGNGRRVFSVLDVDTLAVVAQAEHDLGDWGTLVFGFDWYHDMVDSSEREHEASGVIRSLSNRGVVAGDADYDMAGAFVEDTLALSDRLDLVAGLRWQYVNLSADDVATPTIPTDHISDNWHALTGSLRALYRVSEPVRAFAGVSQGFRAPNLSDATRFDISRTNELEIPATGLEPEYYTTFELGTRYQGERDALAITGWYTLVDDQIDRFRTGGTGPNGEFLVTKANVGDGWLAGFEAEGELGLGPLCACLDDWSLHGFFDYVDGKVDQLDSSGNRVRERFNALPPPTGLFGLRWQDPRRKAGFELFARAAYHVHPSRYTPDDAANTSRIPPDGLPGWLTVGVRGHYAIHDRLIVSAAVENVGDVDYRIMDSGLQEPGTNAVLTVQARF